MGCVIHIPAFPQGQLDARSRPRPEASPLVSLLPAVLAQPAEKLWTCLAARVLVRLAHALVLVTPLASIDWAVLGQVIDLLLQLDHPELASDGQSLELLELGQPLLLLALRRLAILDVDQAAYHGHWGAILVHLHPSATSHPPVGVVRAVEPELHARRSPQTSIGDRLPEPSQVIRVNELIDGMAQQVGRLPAQDVLDRPGRPVISPVQTHAHDHI